MPKKVVTKADLRAFAELLMEQIGPPPDNFEQITEEAITKFREQKKEG